MGNFPASCYLGSRGPDRTEVLVVGSDGRQRPLTHHIHHSPGGLEWGYCGAGPADLARSLLADRVSWVPRPVVYQAFKHDVVAHLPRDGFQVAASEVDAWLARHYPIGWRVADRADQLHQQVVGLVDHLQQHGDLPDDQALGQLLHAADTLASLGRRVGGHPAHQQPPVDRPHQISRGGR